MNLNQRKRQIKIVYNTIARELEEELPAAIPPLVLTKAQTYWGRIRKTWWLEGEETKEQFKDIRISSTLFHQDFKNKPKAFITKLTSTVCHELAHMTHWDHGQPHKELTKQYVHKVRELVQNIDFEEKEVLATIAHSTGMVALADITSNPRKARAALRKAGIERPGNRWEWSVVPQEVETILENI